MSLNTILQQEKSQMKTDLLPFFTNFSEFYWLHNKYAPGLGKSQTTIECIARSPENFVIVIPNHKMIYGKYNMVDNCWKNGISYQARLGKTKRVIESTDHKLKISDTLKYRIVNEDEGPIGTKICMQPSGSEYYPGCKNCAHYNDCLYNQFREEFEYKQIIFSTIQNLNEFPNRIIIFDESIEQQKLVFKTFTKLQVKKLGIHIEDLHTENVCGNIIHYYHTVSVLAKHLAHDAESEEEYFFKLFMKSITLKTQMVKDDNGSNRRFVHVNAFAKLINNGDKIMIFGELIHFLPKKYIKILYNCATIPENLLKKTLDVDNSITLPSVFGTCNDICYDWKIINSQYFDIEKLKNPIIQFKFNWTKKSSIIFLPTLHDFLIQFYTRKRVLIVTKMEFEEDFNNLSECFESIDLKIVHYNAGRGFNTLEQIDEEQYDLVIVYGRFGLDQYTRNIWKKIGYNDNLLNAMEMNEILQALHRCRPLKHPDIPIILMSDRKLLDKMHIEKYPIALFKWILLDSNLDIEKSKPELETMFNTTFNGNLYKQYNIFKNFIKDSLDKI